MPNYIVIYSVFCSLEFVKIQIIKNVNNIQDATQIFIKDQLKDYKSEGPKTLDPPTNSTRFFIEAIMNYHRVKEEIGLPYDIDLFNNDEFLEFVSDNYEAISNTIEKNLNPFISIQELV
jgi:hypothetical protein